jgi:hypothetical protein
MSARRTPGHGEGGRSTRPRQLSIEALVTHNGGAQKKNRSQTPLAESDVTFHNENWAKGQTVRRRVHIYITANYIRPARFKEATSAVITQVSLSLCVRANALRIGRLTWFFLGILTVRRCIRVHKIIVSI